MTCLWKRQTIVRLLQADGKNEDRFITGTFIVFRAVVIHHPVLSYYSSSNFLKCLEGNEQNK